MKKTIRLLVFLLVAVALLLPALVSCNKDERPLSERLLEMNDKDRALALIAEAAEAESKWDSYSVKTTSNMKMVIAGIEIAVKMEGTEKIQGQNDASLKRTIVSTTSMTMLGETSQTLTKSGYQDGKMYVYKSEDGVRKTAMQSAVDVNGYKEFLKSDGAGTEDKLLEDIENCSAATTLKANGAWSVKLYNFGQEMLDMMGAEAGLSALSEDAALENLALKVDLSNTYTFEKVTVTFDMVYEGTRSAVESVMEYKAINSTTVAPIDLSGYQQVHDLRVLYDFADALKDHTYAESGKFEATMTTKMTMAGYTESSVQIYKATHGLKNNKFSCTIDVCEDTDTYQIKYADGIKRVYEIYGAYTELVSNTVSTDGEQLAYIGSIINCPGFSIESATNVRGTTTAGKYNIPIEVREEIINAFLASTSYKCESSSGVITAYFTDGVLTSYEYKQNLTYKEKWSTESYTVETTFIIYFNK